MSRGTAGSSRASLSGFSKLQVASSATRLVASAAIGIAVGTLPAVLFGWSFLPLVGWVVLCLVFLIWSWVSVWSLDADQTRRLSTREDSSRALSDFILILAALAAVLSVALVVFRSTQSKDPTSMVRLGLGVLAIVGSWAVLHTVMTLKYARQYNADDAGGLDFGQDGPPAYRDFAYVAFTVGMTFQVSDTNVTHPRMRSLILGHSLLAYLFGAIIIAVTINLLAGLSQ
jgi:uncharacterized membrane protein